MNIVLLKLIETAVRSLFIVVGTYALGIVEAGQFGLFATLLNIGAFLFGYERYMDLQRKMVGQPSEICDGKLEKALWFWALNYLLILPGFALVMIFWMHFSMTLVAMSLLIVVGEHLANQAYQMAMINQRYRNLMLIVLVKNTGLLGAVGWHIVVGKDLTLAHVVRDWFVVTIFSIVLLALATWRIKARKGTSYPFNFELFRHQYVASFAHFLIGLVAILSVQMDRLVVGAILPGAQIGSYFRQVLLVSLMYQLFSIASYNRILPGIYHKARTENIAALRPLVRKEHLLVICVTAALYGGILLVGSLGRINFFERFHLRPDLLAVLFVGFVIRAGADLNSIMLNGKGLEKFILRYQATALSIGFVFYVALAWTFAIAGAVAAALVAPSVYLFLSNRALTAHHRKEVLA